jgi:radical SAM-linked protein
VQNVPAVGQQVTEEVSALKARIKFRKNGVMKFIGHLDIMRYFQKAIRRAEIPIAFTSGYSPHMIMSFANPLGVGLTSDGEYFDIELTESIASKEAVRRLNEQMVDGMEIVSFVQIPDDKKSKGMSIVAGADYLSSVKNGSLPEDLAEKLEAFYAQNEICVVKKTKKSEKEVDIRPMIYKLECRDGKIYMRVAAGSVQNLKPELVTEAFVRYLGMDAEEVTFTHHRLETFAKSENTEGQMILVPLDALGTEIV